MKLLVLGHSGPEIHQSKSYGQKNWTCDEQNNFDHISDARRWSLPASYARTNTRRRREPCCHAEVQMCSSALQRHIHVGFKSLTLHIPLIHVFLVRDCTRDCSLLDVWELPAVLEPAVDPDICSSPSAALAASVTTFTARFALSPSARERRRPEVAD